MDNIQELNGMTQSQNISVLTDWWEQHHDFGGHVSLVYDRYNLVSVENYLAELQFQYDQISQEHKEHFLNSDVLDNSMPGRNILEDAAKISMLVHAFKQEQMNFHVQLLQEPWFNRWRVHPGSGRYAALWLCGYLMPKMIYTHFNEPEFKFPARSLKIQSADQFLQEIQFQTTGDPDFQTYYAFPKDSQDVALTQERDGEWRPNISTDIPWQFIRYSEGKHFVEYKTHWRKYVMDFNIDKLKNL